MLACSEQGYRLMEKFKRVWQEQDAQTELICKMKCNVLPELICKVKCNALPELTMEEGLQDCVGRYFASVDAIIFFAAVGIAVRSVAPHITHKSKDPAVLVIDAAGKFCIPLLSGHAGGANELAAWISAELGAIPVITTATDVEGKFAVDVFARNNNLAVTDWKIAKEISAAVLAGRKIALISDVPLLGNAPEELRVIREDDGKYEFLIRISCSWGNDIYPIHMLQLVPRTVVVGIGCRRDTAAEQIEHAVRDCLAANRIRQEAVCAVASIKLKAEEKGILAYCEKHGVEFLTYDADTLSALSGEFTESSFVEQTTGVSNVCERSAVCAAGKDGKLISRKTVYGGVTVALAVRKEEVSF